MALKNWTITAESVKNGSTSRESYYHNMSHANHKHTERAFDVHGDYRSSVNMMRNCEAYKLKNQRKGGRPPTDSMEFVLTLPKGIRPSQKTVACDACWGDE